MPIAPDGSYVTIKVTEPHEADLILVEGPRQLREEANGCLGTKTAP